MEACAHWQEKAPADWKGRWKDKLPGCTEVRLELGCGKGRFTVETARDVYKRQMLRFCPVCPVGLVRKS